MHICRLFNVLVIGGFAITGCSGESKDESSEPLAGAGSAGRGGTEAQAGSGGTAGKGAASGGTSSTGTGGSQTNERAGAPNTAGSTSAAGFTGDAGAQGNAGGGNTCDCTKQAPFMCAGICCMWMFGEDAPCCDKL